MNRHLSEATIRGAGSRGALKRGKSKARVVESARCADTYECGAVGGASEDPRFEAKATNETREV